MTAATHLNLAVFLVVLTCLLDSAISGHTKKKIIVKVPHVIKHIHHQHFKPVHVHKVHAKKVEHHHHDSEEKLEHKGHHGSFSHVRPVVEPAEPVDSGESSVEQGNSREGRGYGLEALQERRHQNPWRPRKQASRRPKNIRDDRKEWSPLVSQRGNRDMFNEYEMFGSEEDFPGHREVRQHGNTNKKQNKNSKQRNKKNSQNMDESGWRPMMNFDSWKDIDDVRHNNRGRHYDSYIHSGEDQSEENYKDEGDYREVNHNKKKRKHKSKKNHSNKSKWNKEIKVNEQSSEEEHEIIVQPSKSRQVVTPAPIVQFIPVPVPQQMQVQPQQHTILQQVQHHPIQVMPQSNQQHFKQLSETHPATSHVQHSSWPASQQATSQTQHSSWPAASSPHQWHSQPSSPLTTQSPKVSVWSGHHLELPKHSMWQVQQHSVPASSVPANPIQMLSVSHDSPVLQPAPQHHFSQVTQASQAVHKVVDPAWPKTLTSQDHPGSLAKQVWQQSVQNAGSAYRMEVVNFGTQSNRQK